MNDAHYLAAEWRYTKRTDGLGNCTFALEAKVWPDAWEEFGSISIDPAAEGLGETIAREIVAAHNKLIGQHEQAR